MLDLKLFDYDCYDYYYYYCYDDVNYYYYLNLNYLDSFILLSQCLNLLVMY